MFIFIIMSLSLAGQKVQATRSDRLYLQNALALRDSAQNLVSPTVVRDYTILLTEYYVKQITFRSFFMKDYLVGDNLYAIRLQEVPLTSNSDLTTLVEENLERILINAGKKFPQDPDIEFAIAQYCFRGRGRVAKHLITCDPNRVLDTFIASEGRGVFSAGSLYALSLDSEANVSDDPDLNYRRLSQAYQLNPHDPEILQVLIESLLKKNELQRAWELSNRLFEIATDIPMKLDAVTLSARCLYKQKDYGDALKAVNYGLEIAPSHPFLWMIGLNIYREQNDCGHYIALIHKQLEQGPEHPAPFSLYLEYLVKHGLHSCDQAFVDQYQVGTNINTIGAFIKLSNLSKYYMMINESQKSENLLKESEKMFLQIQNPTDDMKNYLEILKSQLKEAKQHMGLSGK